VRYHDFLLFEGQALTRPSPRWPEPIKPAPGPSHTSGILLESAHSDLFKSASRRRRRVGRRFPLTALPADTHEKTLPRTFVYLNPAAPRCDDGSIRFFAMPPTTRPSRCSLKTRRTATTSSSPIRLSAPPSSAKASVIAKRREPVACRPAAKVRQGRNTGHARCPARTRATACASMPMGRPITYTVTGLLSTRFSLVRDSQGTPRPLPSSPNWPGGCGCRGPA
jgi:hypothetical protein